MTGIQIHVDPKLFGSLDLDMHRNQCRSTTVENRVAVRTVNVWYLCVISCLLNGVTWLIKRNIKVLEYLVAAFHSFYGCRYPNIGPAFQQAIALLTEIPYAAPLVT
jgi:hypothetical protein